MTLQDATLSTLQQDIPSVHTYAELEQAFPSQGETVQVVLKTSPAALPAAVRALYRLESAASARGDFARSGDDTVRTSRDKTVAMLTLATTHLEGSPKNERALAEIRESLAPRYLASLGAPRGPSVTAWRPTSTPHITKP